MNIKKYYVLDSRLTRIDMFDTKEAAHAEMELMKSKFPNRKFYLECPVDLSQRKTQATRRLANWRN